MHTSRSVISGIAAATGLLLAGSAIATPCPVHLHAGRSAGAPTCIGSASGISTGPGWQGLVQEMRAAPRARLAHAVVPAAGVYYHSERPGAGGPAGPDQGRGTTWFVPDSTAFGAELSGPAQGNAALSRVLGGSGVHSGNDVEWNHYAAGKAGATYGGALPAGFFASAYGTTGRAAIASAAPPATPPSSADGSAGVAIGENDRLGASTSGDDELGPPASGSQGLGVSDDLPVHDGAPPASSTPGDDLVIQTPAGPNAVLAVPEPAALGMFGFGVLLMLGLIARRRRVAPAAFD